jgi:polyadenylate-binding protein
VQFFNILDGMALAHLLWHFVAYFLAERALHTLNNSVILDRPCRIRTAGTWIVARNLDASLGRKELYDHFSKFGRILSCKVKLSETGQSKGYGFVHYESEKAAQAAIEKVNNTKFAGKEVYAFLLSYCCFVRFILFWFWFCIFANCFALVAGLIL